MTQTQIRELAQNVAKVALCAYFKKFPTELFKKGFGNSKTQLDAVNAVFAVLETALNMENVINPPTSEKPYPSRQIELSPNGQGFSIAV